MAVRSILTRFPTYVARCAGAAALTACAPLAALAKPAPDAKAYDIPGQDLESALILFGRQSGIDIIYDRSILSGLRSSPLKDSVMPPLAIATMVQGTGLRYRFTSATAVVILEGGQRKDVAGREDNPTANVPQLALDRLRVTSGRMIGAAARIDYRPFGQIVQSAITRRLQEDRHTHGRRFDTRLAVHLDPAGVIRRLSVERSTGDAGLDRDIIRILDGAPMLAIPPAAMPQPIWFEIVAR